MRITLMIVFVLAFKLTFYGQTPITKGLIISSDKFNILYENLFNSISINKEFDSLTFEGGFIKIVESEIFIEPSESGRKNLMLYKNGKCISYPFLVKKLNIKPQIFFNPQSHSNRSKIQEKEGISVSWFMDYDMKLVLKSFDVIIEKQEGDILKFKNTGERFSTEIENSFKNLKFGDAVLFTNVICALPNGNFILAEDHEIVLSKSQG